jgi:ribosomal protein L35
MKRFKYTADFKLKTVNKFLKSELIKKRIYSTRAQAKSEILEYIEECHDRRESL